jgi:hypothetical protein
MITNLFGLDTIDDRINHGWEKKVEDSKEYVDMRSSLTSHTVHD